MDLSAMPRDPVKPTDAQPGSLDKVRLMAARRAKGLPLFHEDDDAPDDIRTLASKAEDFRPDLEGIRECRASTFKPGDELTPEDKRTIEGQIKRTLDKFLRKCLILGRAPEDLLSAHLTARKKKG